MNKERWLNEPLWTLDECAQLCCGHDPDESRGVDGKDDEQIEKLYVAIKKVKETINRAVRAETLECIEKSGVSKGDRVFDADKLFKPKVVTAWASKRYDDFPFKPEDFASLFSGEDEDGMPKLLSIAINAWQRVWVDKELGDKPLAKTIIPWLDEEFGLSDEELKAGSRKAQAIDMIIRPDNKKQGAVITK
ncbi:hypothetical protein [Solemya velum gill symbiont]|uniref:hypothetical protein n=1 Tax=Solemya velum gill symbiont TaxID=2340 RepID=UPI00099889B6|nr:hypothetical protein [Solemya velum gill symbiont]OOY37294.1 hypothetical protein BOV89_07800 [Solemya velum gill symbiont]OOY67270.1 hypothetical protein BOW06_07195 [Solemya velum gill symbiont]